MKKFTKEDAMKGYRTKEEINNIIEQLAGEYGFKFVHDRWSSREGIGEIRANNLNVFTMVDPKLYIYDDFVQVVAKVTFRASISRMGSESTPDELLAIADEIKRCAELVADLNIRDLEFVDVIDK